MTTATFDQIWKKYESLLQFIKKKKGTAECSVRSALLAGENGGKFHTFFEAVIPVMN